MKSCAVRRRRGTLHLGRYGWACFVGIALFATVGARAEESPDLIHVSPAMRRMYDAMLMLQDGEYAESAEALEWVIGEDPTLIGAWETLGWAYWHLGRKAEARRLWERFLLLNPDEPQVYTWLAQLAMERRDLDEAVALYQKALAFEPEAFDVRLSLGRVRLWQGRLGDAVRSLEVLVAEEPERLDVVLELARARQYSLQYAEALPLWERLLAVAPGESEYRLGAALSMLHTGRREEGVAIAREVLEDEPRNVLALTILADDAEYGERPQDARPYLGRAIEASEDPEEVELLRRRLVALLVRLRQADPVLYTLAPAIRVSRDRVADRPFSVDARLLLAELLLMDRKFADSEHEFLRVLREFNPRSMRALRGMLELSLARFRFGEAREYLDALRAFNPRDPYLWVDEAMFYARQGRYTRAHEALDRLERAGGQGAVAVLRYGVLTPSDIGPALPVDRFRDHLTALRDAGYRFLSVDELARYIDQVQGLPDRVAGAAPTRAVVVTFDGGLDHTMQLATPVAQEFRIVFSQFLPVGPVEKENPFVARWDHLRAFQGTGRWQFGSHLLDAHDTADVFRSSDPEVRLANRIRREDLGRLEDTEEFDARLRREYGESRAVIEARLGRPVEAVAYPFGDIGQESSSNEPLAVPLNLAQAETHYRVGFILRSQGHAVQGDNPLLYGRFEPSTFLAGEEMVRHLLSQHPVTLAQLIRLEFAVYEGKRQLARATLKQLERAGYPPDEVARLRRFTRAKLARKFGVPEPVEDARKGPWHLQLEDPYLGAGLVFYRDSLRARSRHLFGRGGLYLTPNISFDARAGVGVHKQPEFLRLDGRRTEIEGADLEVDETWTEGTVSIMIPLHTVFAVTAAPRRFTGDAEWDLLRYAFQLHTRPFTPVDVLASYEHDAVPGARALTRELTHKRISVNGVWSATDRWEVWGAWQDFRFSDDNRRRHWRVLPMFLLWEAPGLRVGLRYEEAHARDRDPDYWTPYRMRSIYAEAGFRGSYLRHYYSIMGRVGRAREGARPEDRAAYDELVRLYEDFAVRARSQRWPQRAREEIDEALKDLRRNPPGGDWEIVYGGSVAGTLRFGEHWEFEGELGHERAPDYHSTTFQLGGRYRF